MANTFKNYLAKDVTTTAANVITVSSGTTTTVIGMTIANMATVPVSANVYITSSGTNYYLVKDASVPVGGSLVPVGGDQKVVLEASDVLSVSSSSNTDIIVSVLEIT